MKVPFINQDGLTQPKRDKWLKSTLRELIIRISTKFRVGRATYGSDIGDQTVDYLLQAIEEEAMDTLMYVRELKRRRVKSVDQQTEITTHE